MRVERSEGRSERSHCSPRAGDVGEDEGLAVGKVDGDIVGEGVTITKEDLVGEDVGKDEGLAVGDDVGEVVQRFSFLSLSDKPLFLVM